VALGLHLLGPRKTEAAWTRALPHFRAAADGGNAHGAYLVGFYHDHIDGGFVAAVNWRSIAAPTGVPAPARLESRRSLARDWYERAARAGSVPARERLAEMAQDD
jgi:TPR repeat protein